MRSNYDLVIIGGGAAGFSAAVAGAEAGANVLLASTGPLGGTCVNYGCVPTKTMVSILSRYARSGIKIKFHEVLQIAKTVSTTLRKEKYEDLLEELGVDYVNARARFKEPGRVDVGGRIVAYKGAVIAVGGKNIIPGIPGIRDVLDRILDNETIMNIKETPNSIAIIGGGPQGIEYSQILARSGVNVTLLHKEKRLLHKAEPEAGMALKEILEDGGVRVELQVKDAEIERVNNRVKLTFSSQSGVDSIEADYIYVAAGRRPQLAGLGLEKVGVEVTDRGYIKVDSTLKAAPGIYAAGDCIGEPMLEPVAAREGYVAALNALGKGPVEMDYTVIPRAVFTDPEYATVGMTERELARKLGVCSCRTVYMNEIPKARIAGEEKGFIKIVVDPRTKKIAGIHMLAYNASEVVSTAAMALKAGLTVDDVIDTIFIFPTMSEALKYGALAFYRDVSKMPCCLL